MSNKLVIENLKSLLANSYALALKTQNYHWNVTGPNFKTLHVLFEEQYNDLSAAIDEIAERIRALGDKAPGSFKAYDKLSIIRDGDGELGPKEMLEDLSGGQMLVIDVLKKALVAAQDVGDEVTIGLIVDRMTEHEKALWMLQSSI